MKLEEKQNSMITEINNYGDCFEQYTYIWKQHHIR